jgi:hypothetical protein
MKAPPPALAWTCLFPAGTSFSFASAPPWLPKLPAPASPSSGLVRITSGSEVTNTDDLLGQVIINPRAAQPDLARAGFTYIRRFAVLPSLRNARWFIPLDSPAIASSAFELYTPARRGAQFKRTAARLAARLSLPIWYRDHLLIASRKLPRIEQAIASIFPDAPLRLAISAGAPEPTRNRKPSFAVIDMTGRILALAKLSASCLSRRLVRHEANILGALAEMPGGPVSAPKLLFAGDVDGHYLAVQSPLSGSPALSQFTAAHGRFLAALMRGSPKPAADTEMLQALPRRIADLPALGPDLAAALDEIAPILETTTVPPTIVHGDFVPWNLRQHDGDIAAFDWEYAQLDGLPLIDETHFRLQVGYHLENWTPGRASQFLKQSAAVSPLGLSFAQAHALQAVYLLDQLARLLSEGYDPADDMIVWYRRVLAAMSRSPKEMVAA